jgi:hypothetical protein
MQLTSAPSLKVHDCQRLYQCKGAAIPLFKTRHPACVTFREREFASVRRACGLKFEARCLKAARVFFRDLPVSPGHRQPHTVLTIPESSGKIVCSGNTGKTFFIGFSVHNDRSIG